MTTQMFNVTGMTCGHCVQAVSDEIGVIPGVERVVVDLVVGEASAVTVHSAQPLERALVAAAVDEAGYELVE